MKKTPKPPKTMPQPLMQAHSELFGAIWEFCVESRNAGVCPHSAFALITCSFMSILGQGLFKAAAPEKARRRDFLVRAINQALIIMDQTNFDTDNPLPPPSSQRR